MSARPIRWKSACEIDTQTAVALANALAVEARRFLGPELSVDVFPPTTIEPDVWKKLVDGAHVRSVHGELREAVLVVRHRDAARIAARIFGEPERNERLISSLETRALERLLTELSPALERLCGNARQAGDGPRATPRNYLQIRFGAPLDASIGVGIVGEPRRVSGPTLGIEALADCSLDCSASLGFSTIDLMTLVTLRVGDVLRLETKVGSSATLKLGASPIAAGEAGVLGDRTALMVHDVLSPRGANR